ncbi:quercetin dioxygenase-like cupin family protein [Inhella inkyongensis]|uniref:Quercetin dioxygenase-like cupin family protein n=1 Tax=Inhella inkyongensis TaxID=392593 RepID=A0A840S378_9BURK|nr:DUF2917 domain-containing protein [Inhella inkyongensis]MBB5203131.1 quercetin dioxygenase-like cupin family protein [Inhella inkyongensis]
MITNANQSSWALQTRQVVNHRVHQAQTLAVQSGRLWLTGAGRLDAPAQDFVLERGQTLRLEPGQSVLIEALQPSDFLLAESL